MTDAATTAVVTILRADEAGREDLQPILGTRGDAHRRQRRTFKIAASRWVLPISVRKRISRIVLQLGVVALAVSGCGGGERTASEERNESSMNGPSQLQIRTYENEYGVCAGSTLAEIKREAGLDQARVTPREAIMKMEQQAYSGPFVRFAFEGCWDGYRGRPQRYGETG